MNRLVVLAFACLAMSVHAAPSTQKTWMSVTLTDSPDPVRQGEPLTYHITVTNHGSSAARNVTVNFSTALQSMPILSMPSSCRATRFIVKCTLKKMAPKASASFLLTLRADDVARRVEAGVTLLFDGSDTSPYIRGQAQVTRILYRIPKPEERRMTASPPKPGGRRCAYFSESNGMPGEQPPRPTLTPFEINGVWVVAMPLGFQNQMPVSIGPVHIGVLFTAIDQPGFPDWITLKRAVFTQNGAEHELLLGQDQKACRPFRERGLEQNEKLLCADPQKVRLYASLSAVMHLRFEDGQGRTFEVVDEFCPSVGM